MLKISFFAVGPKRTGTTWLYNMLFSSVNFPKNVKETMFFDKRYKLGMEWYLKHFAKNTELVSGEIAPSYFHNNFVIERIKKHFPNTKIICTFRDPVERIISLYKLYSEYGIVSDNIEEALVKNQEFIESSKYAKWFSRWKESFGDKNVMGMFFDDLKENPQKFLENILKFIGLPDDISSINVSNSKLVRDPSSGNKAKFPLLGKFGLEIGELLRTHQYYWIINSAKKIGLKKVFFGNGKKIEDISEKTKCEIRNILSEEIEKLEEMTGRDLKKWM